ncbi:DUF441 domain-containing protein [Crassaminicella thermophila]|uniref:UPF0756 membrane protein FQB35_08015 n=1 Tax=Crassaminicella thermophila TaxID=2599308 RepID=A0A5C0SEX4_CRATE|nr:DUF441 domain-containing protein [Crassaminicella thermophila]QEK12326.1 DUF441 domain-containing protein [Crassaminicella thermophila]
MSQEYLGSITLLILLVLAMVGKNNALALSVSALIFFLLLSQMGEEFRNFSHSILIFLDKYGLKLGVIILMMGILAPFALGELDVISMLNSFKTYKGFIGIIAGVLVAIFGARGGYLLEIEPSIVTSVVMGTIFGIVIFKGYPVGPLIGSGIAYFIIYITEIFMKR